MANRTDDSIIEAIVDEGESTGGITTRKFTIWELSNFHKRTLSHLSSEISLDPALASVTGADLM